MNTCFNWFVNHLEPRRLVQECTQNFPGDTRERTSLYIPMPADPLDLCLPAERDGIRVRSARVGRAVPNAIVIRLISLGFRCGRGRGYRTHEYKNDYFLLPHPGLDIDIGFFKTHFLHTMSQSRGMHNYQRRQMRGIPAYFDDIVNRLRPTISEEQKEFIYTHYLEAKKLAQLYPSLLTYYGVANPDLFAQEVVIGSRSRIIDPIIFTPTEMGYTNIRTFFQRYQMIGGIGP